MHKNSPDDVESPDNIDSAHAINTVRQIVTLDTERLKKASTNKGTNKFVRYIGIAETLIFVLLAFLWPQAANDMLAFLDRPFLSVQPVPGWFPLRIFVIYLLLLGCILLFFGPVSWYHSFVLARRQGHATRTTKGYLKYLAKSILRLFTPYLLFTEITLLLRAIQPQSWWLWATLVYLLYTLYDTRTGTSLAFLSFYEVSPLDEHSELFQRLSALMTRLHVTNCTVRVIRVGDRTDWANAYLTGWGHRRSVLLTDTLLQQMPIEEIEIIVAHELGHMIYWHPWKCIPISTLRVLVMLWLLYALPLTNAVPPLALSLVIFMYLYGTYRRRQEYQADEFALRTTRDVQAFKNANTRITNINLTGVLPSLLSTHPTLTQRLAHADEFALRQGIA